jgi:putative DNA methylase
MSGRPNDKRLIEDYLPIEAISKEASREKSVRKGHISTLHLWWARRPLVACRAAVYGALVPASRFRPKNGPEEKRDALARANAAKFVERLCRYPSDSKPDEKASIELAIKEAEQHILEAHAKRLTKENGRDVTVEDIVEGRASRPKVLDMFAGGGAIPLEALRLGCEAYALDLNPVAHIIELCTLVYPQKYGMPDKTAKGSAKDGTWAGLAEEVRYWGNWVLEKVKAEIGDLYPLIPDPKAAKARQLLGQSQLEMAGEGFEHKGQQKLGVDATAGYLTPVAYLWTRTVRCKKPSCQAKVPLVKQTWLCKKDGRYVAMKMVAKRGEKEVRFEIVETTTENGLGFDPTSFSKAGNATCSFCGTVADATYVQNEGCVGHVGLQLMAVVCIRPGHQGKIYVSADDIAGLLVDQGQLLERITELKSTSGLNSPNEPIGHLRPSPNARGMSAVTRHGLNSFADLFSPRQLLSLLHFTQAVLEARREMLGRDYQPKRLKAIATILAAIVDRLADFNSSFCVHNYFGSSRIAHTFGRHALSMVWDFAEANPFHEGSGGWGTDAIYDALSSSDAQVARQAEVHRGTATKLPLADASVDAVITDPPYYDNVPYADISDFFYVWLRRCVGDLYSDHFASELTPKKTEATALASRHNGDMAAAEREYERMMAESFAEANRVLKQTGEMTIVYAHKTTLGWATLVDAMRKAGFIVTEAWPLDTEKPGRLVAQDSAALASSIFLIARKRTPSTKAGNYEMEVVPELESIVRERVETLWEMGISGADLVIACVGAGLSAFTKYASVEYGNGEEVPAGRFLAEVETVVLETILGKLSRTVGANKSQTSLAGLDPPTRFYVLWRYTYGPRDLDAGEAIIFANGTHVELDGLHSLSYGSRPLVEKKKDKYRLLDYAERGDDPSLGSPTEDGQPTPLVDALHRVLWLMERHPSGIPDFLREARPDIEQLRLVAQALAGPALKGGELGEVATGGELAALTKLTANWRSVVEDAAGPAEGPLFKAAKQSE